MKILAVAAGGFLALSRSLMAAFLGTTDASRLCLLVENVIIKDTLDSLVIKVCQREFI